MVLLLQLIVSGEERKAIRKIGGDGKVQRGTAGYSVWGAKSPSEARKGRARNDRGGEARVYQGV